MSVLQTACLTRSKTSKMKSINRPTVASTHRGYSPPRYPHLMQDDFRYIYTKAGFFWFFGLFCLFVFAIWNNWLLKYNPLLQWPHHQLNSIIILWSSLVKWISRHLDVTICIIIYTNRPITNKRLCTKIMFHHPKNINIRT